MADDLQKSYTLELNQKRVREKLNSEKVKLWLPPYTKEDGNRGDIPSELIERYCQDLSLTQNDVEDILEGLRVHALQKLAERDKYQTSGLALLKVKMTGHSKTDKPMGFTLEISLESKGRSLREMLAEKAELLPDQLKVISQGKVIPDQPLLKDQGIKHGSQLLVLCLSVSQAEAAKQQEEVTHLLDTRKAAELLSDKAEKDDTDYDIQIADQSGRPLNLPAEEKKALTLAMTLHEKGRAALKKKEDARALLLLLEADKEFRKCRSDILNAVDNYAVLCLDIVWCYLCLQNVEELPDAENRLKASEECFHRSYGSNMERLVAVKGGSGTELALFMRLHLLQGIVAFHQHKTEEACRLLSKADEELQRLSVDKNKLDRVMAKGFLAQEARLALRVTNGDVEASIQHAREKRKIIKYQREKKEKVEKRSVLHRTNKDHPVEKAAIAEKVEEERLKRKVQNSLGKTGSGDKVNVDLYDMLLGMGFRKGASAEALRQSNNDVSAALEVLHNHPEILDLPDPGKRPAIITDHMLAQVVAMGFDGEMARNALRKHDGNITNAIEDLIKSGGVIQPTSSDESSTSSSASSSSATSPAEDRQKEKKAIEDLMSDISSDGEDYLDLTLVDEAKFLNQYKRMLESIKP